jgi:hypothetical protein
LKGTTSKLGEQLGLIDGDLLRVEIGVPHEEETFELRAVIVKLAGATTPTEPANDEVIFTKQDLCTFRVAPASTTVQDIKDKVITEYNKIYQEANLTSKTIRIRLPKFEDFGDVLKDSETLEN